MTLIEERVFKVIQAIAHDIQANRCEENYKLNSAVFESIYHRTHSSDW